MLLLALGENLWRRFLPRYLQALGAPITAIGLFGTIEDLLDGLYQYPGGWIADRFGRRRALLSFIALAAVGYAVFLLMKSWWVAFAGLALVMVWDSMASPTLFAVVGDALPRSKRKFRLTPPAERSASGGSARKVPTASAIRTGSSSSPAMRQPLALPPRTS